MIVLFVVIALQASAGSGFRIVSTCDESAKVRANIQKNAPLEIHSAVGGGSSCYSVTAMVEGKKVDGYVTDGSLDAVLAFEKAKIEFLQKAMTSAPVLSSLPALPPPVVKLPTDSVASGSTVADKAQPAKEAPKPHKPPILN